MEYRETPRWRTLLEAFEPGVEVTVAEEVKVEIGSNFVIHLPAGLKIKGGSGWSHPPSSREIDPNSYLTINTDDGLSMMLPHTVANSIYVE